MKKLNYKGRKTIKTTGFLAAFDAFANGMNSLVYRFLKRPRIKASRRCFR